MKWWKTVLIFMFFVSGAVSAQNLESEMYLKGTLNSESCPQGVLIAPQISGTIMNFGGSNVDDGINMEESGHCFPIERLNEPKDYNNLVLVADDGTISNLTPWPPLMAHLQGQFDSEYIVQMYPVTFADGSIGCTYKVDNPQWDSVLAWSINDDEPMNLLLDAPGTMCSARFFNIGFNQEWLEVVTAEDQIDSENILVTTTDTMLFVTMFFPWSEDASRYELYIDGSKHDQQFAVQKGKCTVSTSSTSVRCYFQTHRINNGDYTFAVMPIDEQNRPMNFYWNLAEVKTSRQ